MDLVSRRLAIAACELRPCFVREARIRAFPSAVFGPVLGPPCILQRPLGIALLRLQGFIPGRSIRYNLGDLHVLLPSGASRTHRP